MGEEQRAAAFREAFLARAGHELRNPLGALTTAAQILARRAKKRGDPPDRALEIVLESVQNLTKLVEELLDLSRIGRGRLELERTPNTPLGPILVAAAEDTRRVFPEANVEVLVAGEICTGTWDATRLRQAVRHLIENAIVHGKPPIDVKAMAVGPDSVTFRVRDHGEGVPPARRDEVLRPFVRRDRNVGLGLGLAIVTEIARAHGGRCWIGDPEDGQSGCAAFFQIPLANGS
jgi:signal transduction histidine kinase